MSVLGTEPVFSNRLLTQSELTINTVNGSLWYDDNYNIFINPSLVAQYGDRVVVESTPELGSFRRSTDTFVWGIYLNRGGSFRGMGMGVPETQYAPGLVVPGHNARPELMDPPPFARIHDADTSYPVDLFFAADLGIKIGARLGYAYQQQDARTDNTYLHFNVGGYLFGFEPFVGATFFSRYHVDESDLPKGTGKQNLSDWNAGFKFKYENWTPYFVYREYVQRGTPIGLLYQKTIDATALGFGTGYQYEFNDWIKFLGNTGLYVGMFDDDTGKSEYEHRFDTLIVPLTLSAEIKATTWMTLMAGMTFDALHRTVLSGPKDDQVINRYRMPTLRIGNSIQVTNLTFDFAVGSMRNIHSNNEVFGAATVNYQKF
jgi:hypothetical protein